MTINHTLIQQASEFSKNKFLEKTPTSCPFLWFLDDFLDSALLDKLMQFVANDELPWSTVKLQTYANRKSINWIPNTVIEELHSVIESVTPQIEQQLSRHQNFEGISVWKDQYPYKINPHADQPQISSAIQIYLNNSPIDLSTKFEWQKHILTPKNRANCGYFMDNRGKVLHWLEEPVPKNFIRYSLYAIWKD